MAAQPDKTVKRIFDEKTEAMVAKFEELLSPDFEEEREIIECHLCRKVLTSVKMYEQHLLSNRHLEKEKEKVFKAKLLKKLSKDDAKKEEANGVDASPPPNTDSSENLYCIDCDKEFSGYKPYTEHLKGSGHAKSLRQKKLKEEIKGMKEFVDDEPLNFEGDEEDGIFPKPFARCGLCDKTFYGPEPYQQHINGVNHKKKIRHQKLLDKLRKDEDLEDRIDSNEPFFRCDVCNKSFSGPVPYKDHLDSPVHQKELKRVEVEKELSEFFIKDPTGSQYICKECKKAFPDPLSLKSHLANNSHGKQKVKDEMFAFVASNPEIAAVKSVQNVSSDDESEEKNSFKAGNYFLICKMCRMSFSGPESARDHLKSKKHIYKKLEKKRRNSLIERMEEKQSGSQPTYLEGLSDGANAKDKGGNKIPKENGDTTDSVPHALNADDFEII